VEDRVHFLEREPDHVVVEFLDLRHRAIALHEAISHRVFDFRVEDDAEVPQDVVGRERRPVGPSEPASDVVGPHETVGAHFVPRRQPVGRPLLDEVEADERREEEVECEVGRGRAAREERVERVWGTLEREREITAVGSGGTGEDEWLLGSGAFEGRVGTTRAPRFRLRSPC
jgi:hypothetical protein